MSRIAAALFATSFAIGVVLPCSAQEEDAPKSFKACMLRIAALDFAQEDDVQTFNNPDGTTKTFATKWTQTIEWADGTSFVLRQARANQGKNFKTFVDHLDVKDFDLDLATVKHGIQPALTPGWTVTSGVMLLETWMVNAPLVNGKGMSRDIIDDSSGETKNSTGRFNNEIVYFSSERAAHDFIHLLTQAQRFSGKSEAKAPTPAPTPTPPPVAGPTPTSLRACLDQIERLEWRHDVFTMTKGDQTKTTEFKTSFDGGQNDRVVVGINADWTGTEGAHSVHTTYLFSLRDLDATGITVQHQVLNDPQTDGWKIMTGTLPVDIWSVALPMKDGKEAILKTTKNHLTNGHDFSKDEHLANFTVSFESEQAAWELKRLITAASGLAK